MRVFNKVYSLISGVIGMRDVLLDSMLTLARHLDLKLSSYQSSGIFLDFFCTHLSVSCETKVPLGHKPQGKKKTVSAI